MEVKKVLLLVILFNSILALGTLGFYYIEDMTLYDAFYMTVITVSTVGFSEIKPLSAVGRGIAVLIIGTGITMGGYSMGMLMKMIIEGELTKSFGRRKLEKQIAKLNDHYIVCGYGRIGSLICQELAPYNIDFIVIESKFEAIEQIEADGYLYLCADATTEETLLEAGIMKARGLVTAVTSDADNIFIILTAKTIRPDIFVLSRSSDIRNEEKLKKAGANRVVSPYLIGGRRMAQVLIRPTVIDFIDIAMMNSQLGLMMEEVRIRENSKLVGLSLINSNLRQDYGVIIVAIKKSSGDMVFNPTPKEKLDADDVLVVLGKKGDLGRLIKIL